jgi:hypothetical protein
MPVIRSAAFVLLVVLALGCRWVPFPGGRLDGHPKPVPEDWSFLAETSIVQIETRPEDPYSVNIWAVGMGPVVYLHAGANRATWVEHLEADPRLRMQVDEDVYELRATRVTGQDEFDRFADAYDAKYGVRPRNENVAEVYLLRLGPR